MSSPYPTIRTKGTDFYRRQLDFLIRKDVDGLIEMHYAEDAELVSFDYAHKGHAELKAHFTGYLEALGDITVLSTDKFTETEDTIFFEATVHTAFGEAQVYDVFVLENGKIRYHFAGVK